MTSRSLIIAGDRRSGQSVLASRQWKHGHERARLTVNTEQAASRVTEFARYAII